MAQSKNRLGRGLGGLISGGATASSDETEKSSKSVALNESSNLNRKKSKTDLKKRLSKESESLINKAYREIEINSIKANPYQPRRDISNSQVEELAKSIRSEGLLQPIVVRASGKGFELIAGERRLRAFKVLNEKLIPSRVIEASDSSSATLALIENLQRENLNPIDEAIGYSSLVRDFDLTQEAAADRVGKGRATVANALRLLSLSVEIKGFLSRRLLSTGHAKVLLGIKDESQRHLLARRIIESNISVREAEKMAKRINEPYLRVSGKDNQANGEGNSAENTAIADLEKRIEKHFNTNVSIRHGKKKGKLIIEYFGNEDLDRLLELLGINHN